MILLPCAGASSFKVMYLKLKKKNYIIFIIILERVSKLWSRVLFDILFNNCPITPTDTFECTLIVINLCSL